MVNILGGHHVWTNIHRCQPSPPGAILLGKMAYVPKQIRRECSEFRLKGGGVKRDDLLDQLLYEWYSKQLSSSNVKITGTMLRVKANELAKTSVTGSEGSKFSHGWLQGFKKKYGIQFAPDKETNKEHRDNKNQFVALTFQEDSVTDEKNCENSIITISEIKQELLDESCMEEK